MSHEKLIQLQKKTIAAQAEQLALQKKQLQEQAELIVKLQQQVESLLRQLYGKKSEKKKPVQPNNTDAKTNTSNKNKTNDKQNNQKKSLNVDNSHLISQK